MHIESQETYALSSRCLTDVQPGSLLSLACVSHRGSTRAGVDAYRSKASEGGTPRAYSRYLEEVRASETLQMRADTPPQ